MLKTLLTAALLLLVTSTAKATPMTGIDGSFDLLGLGTTTLNANGEIETVQFNLIFSPLLITGDYSPYLTNASVFNAGTLDLNNIIGVALWAVEGFTFTGTSVVQNNTDGNGTSVTIIGDVSHAGFITTSTQWFFSTQGLSAGSTTMTSFSSKMTSPYVAPVTIPEPGTIAILAFGLMGFAVNRKKKSA